MTKSDRQRLKGNLLLLMTALIWGTSFISQSKGVETLSASAFNGIRSLLGGVVLLPVIAVLDCGKRRRGEEVIKLDKRLLTGGLICGTLLCAAATVQTQGMVYTSPGKSGFITALYMIIVPIIGLFTGKRPRPIIFVSALIAAAGLYLVCVEPGLELNRGDMLTLVCAFIFSGHILAVDFFAPRTDGVKLSCLQFLVSGAINMIYVLIFEELDLGAVIACAPAIGYSGIMSCGVAYTFQVIGQKYTDPTSASILMSLESVFAALSTAALVACGINLTGGALSARELLGCAIMFAAIILIQLPEKNGVAKR